ncbi:cartilage-associated protein-like [Phthorimaea operculella]|nr:cartilage-associated protein-like [Phthorimaea operculella]
MVGFSSLKLIAFLFACAIGSSEALRASLDKAYQKGTEAYKGERWSECIKNFEESMHLYKLYKTITGNCRLNCNSKQYETQVKDNIEDLQFFEKYFNMRNCLKVCKEFGFEDVNLQSDVSDFTLHAMQSRKPYEYIHMCYYQMNMLPKAASSVFTFLVAYPDDETMQQNLQYYLDQPEVDANEIVDLQSEDYAVLYKLGIEAYKNKNWKEAIASMEEVITDYLSSENNCRVECERQPEQEWSPEFVITLSNTMASLLNCHQTCQERLKLLGYGSGVEFLADVLNYIQISYYHIDSINQAAKAVASYLVLLPNDPDMLSNKKIYTATVGTEAFIERSDIVYYFRRRHKRRLRDNPENEVQHSLAW